MPKKTGKPSNRPVKAAIYARQSKELSEGIERQVELCKKLCKSKGWVVAKVYEDNDVSAYKNRGHGTAWAEMLDEIDDLEIDVVIATNMDRLLRRVPDLAPLVATGVSVLTVDGELDLDSAEGEFMATMGAGLAQFETKRKAERQIRANDAKSSKGIPVPSRRRYGYQTDGCTPIEEEAKEVQRIFKEFAEGASIRSLAKDMQDRNVDPGGGKGWPVNRIRGLLANVFYGGEIIHRGVVSDSEYVVPIVSKELARDVRAILSDPARRTSPGAAISHVLTGLANCGVCGETMHHMTDYKCRKALNHVQIKAKKLEELVMWEVHKWASENTKLETQGSDSDEIRKLLIESKAILDRIVLSQDMASWPGADIPSLKAKIAKDGKEREAIEQKIEKLRSKNASHAILKKIHLAWNAPIDAKSFANWQKAMRDSADALGWSLEESDLSTERYEHKMRIERQISEWPIFWNAVPLDQKREVIRSVLVITVNKGTSLDRVVITRA